MFKIIAFLYVVSYSCYIFYTREPDYFDGEVTKGIVMLQNDNTAVANYVVENKHFSVNAQYLFRQLKNGEQVEMIYHPAHPENATVYSLWGYWFKWTELLMSFVLIFGLYQLAVGITNNPSENVTEEVVEEKARKYV